MAERISQFDGERKALSDQLATAVEDQINDLSSELTSLQR